MLVGIEPGTLDLESDALPLRHRAPLTTAPQRSTKHLTVKDRLKWRETSSKLSFVPQRPTRLRRE